MKWFNIYKDGTPNRDRRILTYSERHENNPELAYRILDGQFVPLCKDITHYMYLRPQMMTKQRYQGNYNYNGEIHTLWTHAKCPAAAHRQFISQVSKLLGISNYKLRCHFNNGKDNFKIKEK